MLVSKWKIYAYVPLPVKYVFRVVTFTATRTLPNYRSSVVENLHVIIRVYVNDLLRHIEKLSPLIYVRVHVRVLGADISIESCFRK